MLFFERLVLFLATRRFWVGLDTVNQRGLYRVQASDAMPYTGEMSSSPALERDALQLDRVIRKRVEVVGRMLARLGKAGD